MTAVEKLQIAGLCLLLMSLGGVGLALSMVIHAVKRWLGLE